MFCFLVAISHSAKDGVRASLICESQIKPLQEDQLVLSRAYERIYINIHVHIYIYVFVIRIIQEAYSLLFLHSLVRHNGNTIEGTAHIVCGAITPP